MKHAAVAMDVDGSHKLIPLDEDVSIFFLFHLGRSGLACSVGSRGGG